MFLIKYIISLKKLYMIVNIYYDIYYDIYIIFKNNVSLEIIDNVKIIVEVFVCIIIEIDVNVDCKNNNIWNQQWRSFIY
jgi:hypothetical protein